MRFIFGHIALLLLILAFLLSACTPTHSISDEIDPQGSEKIIQCHDENNSYGIVNGKVVDLQDGDVNKAVLLLIKRGDSISSCTGVPISSRVILTAAHCLKNVAKEDVVVIFHPEMTCKSGFDLSKTIRSIDLMIHADYSETKKARSDLGLVELASPIPNSYPIASIYRGGGRVTSDRVLMIGYGTTSEEARDSLHLRKTIKSLKKANLTPEHNIIFEQNDSTGGVCLGDSGGPIYAQIDGEYKVIGINSVVIGLKEGSACHQASMAMYAPHYADWIQENLQKLETSP